MKRLSWKKFASRTLCNKKEIPVLSARLQLCGDSPYPS